MAVIKSGASTDQLTVDVTSKAARATLYDTGGTVLTKADKSAIVPATTPGLPIVGADGSLARLARSMSDGSLANGQPVLEMFDPIEGAAVNTNTWTQTTTTMTIAQASGVITFNNGSSFATTVGALQTAQHLCPIMSRSKTLFRSRQRHGAHFNNNLIELGFMTPASATASAIGSGAVWRKDGTGQYVPVLSIAGSETLGTPISNATIVAAIPSTNYALYEVEADGYGAWFRIVTMDGVLVSEQRVNFPGNTGDWTVSHLTPAIRIYNSASTGTAVQLFVAETAVYSLDVNQSKPWAHQMAGNGWGHFQSPTAYTQTANYTNVTAPTTRTVTNTTALEATLGGHCSWSNGANSFAANEGAASDLIIFGYQIPTPYAFYCTGIRIDTVNLGAANGAAAYTIEYSLAANSNAVSLATAAPNAPRFIPLGFSNLAGTAAIGTAFSGPIDHAFSTPIVIQPGRFIHVVARVIGASAATASQVIRTVALLEGYYV